MESKFKYISILDKKKRINIFLLEKSGALNIL